MSDVSTPEFDDERSASTANAPPLKPPTPRWVKVFGIAALFLITLFVISAVVNPGMHGPGRHGGAPTASQHNDNSLGGPADASEAARTIEITTVDSPAYEPAAVTVSASETVTFVIRNTGRAVHEFTLGDTATQKEHSKQAAGGAEHSGSNTVTVQPGETKQLTWRFGEAGTLEYACHVAGHYEAGMRGTIRVT